MKLGEAVQIRNKDLTVIRVNELELFQLSNFIRKLADASVTPEMWYAVADLISKISPETTTGDDPLVEVDRFDKSGRVNLTGEEFNQYFSAVYEAWKGNTPSESKVIVQETSEHADIDMFTVEEMKAQIARIEASATEPRTKIND